jgi:hypothetical protein
MHKVPGQFPFMSDDILTIKIIADNLETVVFYKGIAL